MRSIVFLFFLLCISFAMCKPTTTTKISNKMRSNLSMFQSKPYNPNGEIVSNLPMFENNSNNSDEEIVSNLPMLENHLGIRNAREDISDGEFSSE